MKIKAKKTKVKILLYYMVFLLAASGIFCIYNAVYRGRTEPDCLEFSTNTDAAVYNFSQFCETACENSILEDCGIRYYSQSSESETYVIPGLLHTRTCLPTGAVDTCTSMTPQGLAVTGDYLFISAYCHTGRHHSVLYMLDKHTHAFLKEIVLPDRSHAGGLAYDPIHRNLWVSGRERGVAQANYYSLEALEAYSFSAALSPLEYTEKFFLYGITRDSFLTYHDQALYVGFFTTDADSVIEKFAINPEGGLVETLDREWGLNMTVPIAEDIFMISGKAQGITFCGNQVLISQSYGIFPSKLRIFDNLSSTSLRDHHAEYSFSFPCQMEQICADNDDLYLLFESAAYSYRGYAPTVLDRVIKIHMDFIPD